MVASSQSRALAERIPNSKLVIYPDSGHGGIFQYHERFVPAVLEFLDADDPIGAAGSDRVRLDLPGKTVAITGAGGGLGAGLARALRAHGANVALLDLTADGVQAQAAQLGGDRYARGWAVDVRDFDAQQQVFADVAEHFGAHRRRHRRGRRPGAAADDEPRPLPPTGTASSTST